MVSRLIFLPLPWTTALLAAIWVRPLRAIGSRYIAYRANHGAASALVVSPACFLRLSLGLRDQLWAERTAIEASTAAEKRGQIFALIIAVSGFVTTIVLAWLNHPLVAGGVAGLDILGLVSVFLYGTSSRKDERIKKARIMTGRATDETSPTRQ